jgi:hypothetical protein
MAKRFEVRWDGELSGTPEQVWDAITVHTAGWLWKVEYEPRVGGAERGLTMEGGEVTGWEPPRRFVTRAPDGDGFNELEYRLEPRGAGTHLGFVQRGVLAEGEYDLQLDACRRHTAFYYHTLGEYVRHFAGRDATHVAADGPPASADGGFTALRRALGIRTEQMVGDRVNLTPTGLPAIDGVVDYATPTFLGVRTADALYRFYGRDTWGWPIGVAHHHFGGATGTAEQWTAWLNGVFVTGAVA